jgi:membrane associated rhomboid family serine protease
MFAVYMFGQIFEHFWGGWKYLLYYFTAGIGAALVQEIIWYIDFNAIMQNIEFHKFELVKENGWKILQQGENYTDLYAGKLNILFHVPTIGASGAVFGILLAFGVMFPHERIYFMFMLPIQARFFVIIYGIAELFFGVANFSGDNVAHFAHLGGLFFGLLLILWWKHKGKLFNHKIF